MRPALFKPELSNNTHKELLLVALSYFLQAAALGLTAAASPGLFQTFLINQSLLGGWRRGAPVAFSPFISDPPVVITILLLLNQLPAGFIRWVSLAGGLFALYLAWGGWQQWRSDRLDQSRRSEIARLVQPAGEPGDEAPSNPWHVMWRGALMNLLSPGPYTFWTLVLGPLLLESWRRSPLEGVSFLAGFYGAFVGGMGY